MASTIDIPKNQVTLQGLALETISVFFFSRLIALITVSLITETLVMLADPIY
jgi:hypothetical protein